MPIPSRQHAPLGQAPRAGSASCRCPAKTQPHTRRSKRAVGIVSRVRHSPLDMIGRGHGCITYPHLLVDGVREDDLWPARPVESPHGRRILKSRRPAEAWLAPGPGGTARTPSRCSAERPRRVRSPGLHTVATHCFEVLRKKCRKEEQVQAVRLDRSRLLATLP